MSGISKKIPSGPTIVKPRLITVGRGRALPRVESQPRPGPAHHAGPVSQSSSGLRRPKLVRQEPSAPDSSSISMKEKNKMRLADIDRNGVAGPSTVQQGDQLEKMKERLAVFKEDNGANLEILKKQIEMLQKENDKDIEIKRLNNDNNLPDKAKEGSVLHEVSSPSLDQNSRPPLGRFFQFPERPQSSPQYSPPPVYFQNLPGGFHQAASVPQTVSSAGQPSQGETDSAVNLNKDDLDCYDAAFIEGQEEILKQIEQQNMKKKLEETRSLKLIQKLSLDGELASSSRPSLPGSDSFYPQDQVAASMAPVPALRLGDVVNTERRPQTERKVSEFEAKRSRAVFELKQRIKAQVSKGTGR